MERLLVPDYSLAKRGVADPDTFRPPLRLDFVPSSAMLFEEVQEGRGALESVCTNAWPTSVFGHMMQMWVLVYEEVNIQWLSP